MNRHTSGNDAGGRSPARRLLLLTILVATAALIVQVGSALAENSHLNYFPQTGELDEGHPEIVHDLSPTAGGRSRSPTRAGASTTS